MKPGARLDHCTLPERDPVRIVEIDVGTRRQGSEVTPDKKSQDPAADPVAEQAGRPPCRQDPAQTSQPAPSSSGVTGTGAGRRTQQNVIFSVLSELLLSQ